KLYGSKESGGALYELQMYNDATPNNVTWNENGTNTLSLSQDANGWTKLNGKVYGVDMCEAGMYEITKTAEFDSTSPADVGDMIIYTIQVENVANEDIPFITVVDPLLGGELSNPIESQSADGVLNLGETWTYEENYTITAGDLAAGGVYNQA